MAVWREVIEVSAFFQDKGPEFFEENREGIVEALKASRWYREYQETPGEPSLLLCVKELEEADHIADFDYFWNLLYSLADRDRVWIETIL